MAAQRPQLSPYALCEVEDVADLLGYDDEQTSLRQRTIVRAINSASSAIPRRAQREFVQTAAEKAQTRFQLIERSDVFHLQGFQQLRSGRVRLGDFSALPTAVSTWSPDRDVSFDFDVTEVTGNLYILPDVPDPGFPYEFLQIKSTSPIQLVEGWWISVTTDWGFPQVPDGIVEIAICTAASLILNDTAQLTDLARQAGRRVSVNAVIPSEYLDEIDSYRLFRVG